MSANLALKLPVKAAPQAHAAAAAPGFADTLFITRKWAPAIGGMETWSLRLSEELGKLGPLEVLALPGQSDGHRPGALAMLGFGLKAVRHYLTRPQAPALLHVGDMAMWPLGLLPRLRGGKTKVLLTSFGTDVAYPRRGGWRGWLYGRYLALGARLLGQTPVLTISRASADETRLRGFADARVVLLATDFALGQPRAVEPDTILFVGRLVERKGCAWFIRNVLPLLPQNVRLKVIGKTWDADESAALANPRVDYLGTVDQAVLEQAIQSARCVVMPNILPKSGDFEGFGIVAAEVAAAGGVLLAARCGGLKDAVTHGVSGLLIEPEDAPGWARAIEQVGSWKPAERARFIAGGQAHVDAELRWPRVGRDVARLYAELAP